MSKEYVVGKIQDLPEGSRTLLRVNSREVAVFCINGRYSAIPNVCFHQNGPLCRGAITGTVEASQDTNWKRVWVREGEIIVCPWHAMEYNLLTGQCLAYPHRSLPLYKVKVENGSVILVL